MRLGAEHRDVVQSGAILSSSSSVRTPAMPLPTINQFHLLHHGVHGVLKPQQVAALALQGDAEAASDALVHAALDAGTRDNATALVIRVVGLDARQLDDELGDGRRLAPPPLLKVGDVLDGYVVTALVADTGVHLLYQARHPTTRELVALKTLHPSRAGDPQERAMLAHEAWLGQRVGEGGGFVRVHERAENASALYIVFDWHGGRTLEQMLKSGAPARWPRWSPRPSR
jgi:hypothetical protein